MGSSSSSDDSLVGRNAFSGTCDIDNITRDIRGYLTIRRCLIGGKFNHHYLCLDTPNYYVIWQREKGRSSPVRFCATGLNRSKHCKNLGYFTVGQVHDKAIWVGNNKWGDYNYLTNNSNDYVDWVTVKLGFSDPKCKNLRTCRCN